MTSRFARAGTGPVQGFRTPVPKTNAGRWTQPPANPSPLAMAADSFGPLWASSKDGFPNRSAESPANRQLCQMAPMATRRSRFLRYFTSGMALFPACSSPIRPVACRFRLSLRAGALWPRVCCPGKSQARSFAIPMAHESPRPANFPRPVLSRGCSRYSNQTRSMSRRIYSRGNYL
jgi:hypothetical protein